MDDILIINIVWLTVGALAIWYVDKRAYNEGMIDAIVMHSNGNITYTTYEEDGEQMIEMKVSPNED
jgi:hypothetical protein